jgi:NAD-dependent histone deacetylase SIR2
MEAKLIRQLSGKRIGGLTIGFLRPNIVLYGEDHPHAEVITTGLNTDLKSKPDMLLIMGTSLKVHGVKQLVRTAAQAVHARGGLVVLINDTVINGWNGVIDYQVQTQCDEFFKHHESFEQQLLSPPTTPQKKRTVMLPSGGTKRKLTDITNVDQYKKRVPRGGKTST